MIALQFAPWILIGCYILADSIRDVARAVQGLTDAITEEDEEEAP